MTRIASIIFSLGIFGGLLFGCSADSPSNTAIFTLYETPMALPDVPAALGVPDDEKSEFQYSVLFDLAKKSVISKILSDHNIEADSDSVTSQTANIADAITTQSIQKLNEDTAHALTIAEAYIDQFGENNVSEANINEFRNNEKNSATLSLLPDGKVNTAIQVYGTSRDVIGKIRNQMENSTIESFQEMAKTSAKESATNSAKLSALKQKFLQEQPLTDEERSAVKKKMAATPELIGYAQSDQKAESKAQDIKGEYLLDLLVMEQIADNSVIHDKAAFDECRDAWEARVLKPWENIFPDARAPDVSTF